MQVVELQVGNIGQIRLVPCHIPHHTTNNNQEPQSGGGLMLLLEASG